MTVRLIDKDAEKQKRLFYLCKAASKVVLFHGLEIRNIPNCNELIEQYWEGDDEPSTLYSLQTQNIYLDNLKWCIHNHITYEDDIWNADFLHGLTCCGKMTWAKKKFPSFRWFCNEFLVDIIETSPFVGKVVRAVNTNKIKQPYRWSFCPAFYLKADRTTISYLAGVLATGTHYVQSSTKLTYAKYSRYALSALESFGIPIEFKTKQVKRCLISPIWPALFSPYMPEICRDYWCNINIKSAFNVKLYAPILWLTYVDSNFPKGGIPYLQSRRMIMYQNQCSEGAIKSLQQLRVEKNLVSLDKRVKECVHQWAKKQKEEK